MKLGLVLVLVAACGGGGARPAPACKNGPVSAPLLTQASEVAGHVGQVVTLHGTIERSKIASLLGVDVASDSPDLRGQQGWATGTLERFEEPDPMEGGIVRAGRAAGSYLRLVDADGKLAQVSAGAPPAPAPCDR